MKKFGLFLLCAIFSCMLCGAEKIDPMKLTAEQFLKIVRHVPLLTFGRHKADDDVIIVLSMLPIWRILYWPARRQ